MNSTSITVRQLAQYLESIAPPALQESYDNIGLQTGSPGDIVKGVLVTLDVTEQVLEEAMQKGANVIVAHHPVIFGGLKRLTGANSTERILLSAVRNHLSIFVAHTNIDSVEGGVNTMIANKIGLQGQSVLKPVRGVLRKLVTYVPESHLEPVRMAIFSAGAGHIGAYDQCSFTLSGTGTFRGGETTQPFVGTKGKIHSEPETRLETVFPGWLEAKVIEALIDAHPYEEVAYDIYPLENGYSKAGIGVIGNLPEPVAEMQFLSLLKDTFKTQLIRHSRLSGNKVSRVAVCGGAGSFLINEAIAAGAEFFVTGDVKYHQFMEAEGRTVLADIGHYESEQFTKELFSDILLKKFPTFAVDLSETVTNPVSYF